MNITLSVEDEIIQKASRKAEIFGTSVNQLLLEYIEQLAGGSDQNRDADEFVRLSQLSQGNSQGWKFNRAEIHERE